jgi:hypothetical protein
MNHSVYQWLIRHANKNYLLIVEILVYFSELGTVNNCALEGALPLSREYTHQALAAWEASKPIRQPLSTRKHARFLLQQSATVGYVKHSYNPLSRYHSAGHIA